MRATSASELAGDRQNNHRDWWSPRLMLRPQSENPDAVVWISMHAGLHDGLHIDPGGTQCRVGISK